ncbi:MAG: response regulator [Candidatus Omnitrophota bacterium]|nr:response regulator [Candidatus Omnitrophota bacterium]
MPKVRILIVEDEKNIAKLIRYNLEKAGYDCTTVKTGEEAISILEKQAFDLMILDIMLPGIDGFEVCRKIKQYPKTRNMPIIMLTAKGEEVDKIVGLELGADDYMVKPFSPRELVLRIKAILKRGKTDEQKKELITIGDISVDIPKHRVTVKNKDVALTNMEFRLLLTLMERQGRVQDRDKLLNDVWNIDTMINTRTIDTHVKKLREKLGKAGDMIETVRGMGYRIREADEN